MQHWPSQAVLQHTLSTQKPEAHSEFAAQASASGLPGLPTAASGGQLGRLAGGAGGGALASGPAHSGGCASGAGRAAGPCTSVRFRIGVLHGTTGETEESDQNEAAIGEHGESPLQRWLGWRSWMDLR